MKKGIKMRLFLLIISFSFYSVQLLAQVTISGDVSGLWTAADNPYYITGNTTVPEGKSLTIRKGVEINFIGTYYFRVDGLLKAFGTADEMIHFHGDGGAGSWKDIFFSETAEAGCILDYCIIQDGGHEFEANICIYNNKNNITVSNSTIKNSSGNGIVIGSRLVVGALENNKKVYCNSLIKSNIISQNMKNGILVYSYFMDTNHGVQNNSSIVQPLIENNLIFDNSEYGIHCDTFCDGGSNYGFDTGIVTKTIPKICKNTINNNSCGICCTKTKQGFFYGTNIIATNPFVSSNIFYKNDNYGLDLNSLVDVDSIKHNNFFQNSEGNLKGIEGGLGTCSRRNLNGDSCDANSNIFFDPGFVDVSNNNFHLMSTSKCIDAGDLNLERDPDGSFADIGAFYFDQTTDIEISNILEFPVEYALEQNYPNPFNPTTTIRFQLPAACKVKLTIFNSLGQIVRTLIHEYKGSGSHESYWDGTDDVGNSVSSGIYLYRLEAGKYVKSNKMVMVR
ncbi:MAG: T9SS type A sorting domain-containing protein [Candidatus Lokiarchaeota archaeon]|nr:T9SS type A sorting domain-containing protein [Candidatus Lokiarchaeota archaeon]